MEILISIPFLILTIFAMLIIPPLMTRRAIKHVLERFIYLRALNEDTAKSIHELGMEPRNIAKRMVSLRDYKPKVLDELVGASIVVATEDGKLFLSLEKLRATPFLEKWPHLSEHLKPLDVD